jgi:replicative superfamily II helicase
MGPAVYLCANNFLSDQTIQQAKEFGITNVCDDPDDSDFIAGRSILINNVNKLFNGRTRFKLGPDSHPVGTLLLDDSHACADGIRSAFSITLKSSHSLYAALRDLFEPELELQGLGTYADIKLGKFEAILPVPYWAWRNRLHEVTRWIAKAAESDEIKYSWPILKDSLLDCACVFSGTGLEIAPYLPDLSLFGSYWKAKHRVFMSATVTNDAFLVKGLNLSPSVIRAPLTYDGEQWYGEKMILIPSLVDPVLGRTRIIDGFAGVNPKRKSGIVALVPGARQAADWRAKGSLIVDKNTIIGAVRQLKAKSFSQTLVIANYYDGIDLPDDACRILILDSKPFSNGLIDTYSDSCRASSEVTSLKLARTIEQGLGRAVRGQKDYCVIILIGANLVRAIRSGKSRLQFSRQTQQQVSIGLTVSEDAKNEVGEGIDPTSVLNTLINQCLGRDEGWKAYYQQEMEKISVVASEPKMLDIFAAELKAELQYREGAYEDACRTTQELIDTFYSPQDTEDRGWYLQEMARYILPIKATESNELQVKAHKKNKYLLRPQSGFNFEKLVIGQKRVAALQVEVQHFAEKMLHGQIVSAVEFGGAYRAPGAEG